MVNYVDIEKYESLVNSQEVTTRDYFYLGIGYLLTDRLEESQAIWFLPFGDIDSDDDIITLTQELTDCCNDIINQAIINDDLSTAWVLRQALFDVNSTDINNLLELIVLSIELDEFSLELLNNWQVLEVIKNYAQAEEIKQEFLPKLLLLLFRHPSQITLDLIKLILTDLAIDCHGLIKQVSGALETIFLRDRRPIWVISLIDLFRSLNYDDNFFNSVLCQVYPEIQEYQKAIDSAKLFSDRAKTLNDKLFGMYLYQRGLFTAGNWQDSQEIIDQHQTLLDELLKQEKNSDRLFISSAYFLPYIQDNARENRLIQNKIASLYQQTIKPTNLTPTFLEDDLPKPQGVLRIGYIASTLKKHSVGWLSRWLFKYYDRQSFQTFLYCLNQQQDDPFHQQWFRSQVDITGYFTAIPEEIAAQIKQDKIDILVDLDSLTFNITTEVMALKPAPIQVSWLGWDASGLETIDYFIADPYVLPDNAQEYYREKIWRLPQNYIGVDGFEIGIPDINRQSLNIPENAVIYWTGQKGYKRHPDTIKLQLEIIKKVPNSYLLIKGEADRQRMENFINHLAIKIGISLDRLRFLPQTIDEYTHRANLQIADVVLDTFPYNGATTTLETLWLGIPIVTLVGQQFSARNSYTFMVNAGIQEGIAWTAQEYIDWGVKLGLDHHLRAIVSQKLHQSKFTSPLWNGRKFTQEMEKAYRQMWANL